MARDVLRKGARITICSAIVLALLFGAGYLIEGKFSKRVCAESSEAVEKPTDEDFWQDDRRTLDDEWFERNERALREEMRRLEEFIYRLFAEKIDQIGRAIPREPGMSPDFFAPDMDIDAPPPEPITTLRLKFRYSSPCSKLSSLSRRCKLPKVTCNLRPILRNLSLSYARFPCETSSRKTISKDSSLANGAFFALSLGKIARAILEITFSAA